MGGYCISTHLYVHTNLNSPYNGIGYIGMCGLNEYVLFAVWCKIELRFGPFFSEIGRAYNSDLAILFLQKP